MAPARFMAAAICVDSVRARAPTPESGARGRAAIRCVQRTEQYLRVRPSQYATRAMARGQLLYKLFNFWWTCAEKHYYRTGQSSRTQHTRDASVSAVGCRGPCGEKSRACSRCWAARAAIGDIRQGYRQPMPVRRPAAACGSLWRWARMGAPPRRARRGASVSCCDVAGIPGPRSRFAVNAAVRSGVRTGQLCQSLGYTPGPGQGSDRRVSATPRGHRPSRRPRVHFCPALWRSRRSRRAPQICAVQQPARDPDSGIARRDHVDRVARTAGDRAQARATRGHHIRRLAPRRRFRCPTIGREGHRRR